jgi:hypothetical protein
MNHLLHPFFKEATCLVLLTLALGGCTTPPATPPVSSVVPAVSVPRPTLQFEKHHVESGGGVSVDYQIERKISSANGISCFAFITGTLNNDSDQVLSRRTVLDFVFLSGGKLSFRDLTYPLKDAPPASRTPFEMVVSPVHKEGCIPYDKINVSVRKIVANRVD